MDGTSKSLAEPGAATAKSSRSMLAVGIAFGIAAAGAWAWFSQQQRDHNADTAVTTNSAAPKYIAHLDGFTVNLADPEDTHFLRVSIDLGIDHLPEGADKTKPQQSLPTPRIRDAILSVLTVCKANELVTPEGKAQLKKNLMEALNKSAPELGVREIYFTEFLVQR
jgi:flagellar protein FliL